MSRTQCALALLALFVGLAHSFSWDIVLARETQLEFYNDDGTLTYSVKPSPQNIYWITYDPLHNRVLFSGRSSRIVGAYSYDIANNKTDILTMLKPNKFLKLKAYDPATELLFGTVKKNIYSFSLKPGSNNDDGNLVISFEQDKSPRDVAVDSCGGYIYWTTNSFVIERARFNGAEREVIIDSSINSREGLSIDQQTQKLYWVEITSDGSEFSIENADLNGKNRNTIYVDKDIDNALPDYFTISKDFIYWGDRTETEFWILPKNSSQSKVMKPKRILINNMTSIWGFRDMAANYAIKEQIQGINNCKALKSLLPNYSETSDCNSQNDSTDLSLLCVHGKTVSGESRCECAQGYIGDRCDVSVCQNYCLQGECNASAEGQPTCRCNAGYSGKRCEINACQGYCLNNGVCTMNEDIEPVCQCTGDYEGGRCEFPVFLVKCFQTVSMLKDILHADTTSITLSKGVNSTCASTAVSNTTPVGNK